MPASAGAASPVWAVTHSHLLGCMAAKDFPTVILWGGKRHDGAVPLAGVPRKPTWHCNCAFENFGGRLCCLKCHTTAPKTVLDRAQAAAAKSKKDARAQGKEGPRGGGGDSKEVARLKKEIAGLQKKNESLQIPAAAAAAAGNAGDGSGSGLGSVDVAAKIKLYEGLIASQAAFGSMHRTGQA